MNSAAYGTTAHNNTSDVRLPPSIDLHPPILPVKVGWVDPHNIKRVRTLYAATLRLTRPPMYRTLGYMLSYPDGRAPARLSTMSAMQMTAGALVRRSDIDWAMLVTSDDRDTPISTTSVTATAHKLIARMTTRVRQVPSPATLHMRSTFFTYAHLSLDRMASRAFMDMVMDAVLYGQDVDHGNGWFAIVGDPVA